MTRGDDNKIIEIVHSICCGLDIHKKKISACIIYSEKGKTDHCEIMEFGTPCSTVIGMNLLPNPLNRLFSLRPASD